MSRKTRIPAKTRQQAQPATIVLAVTSTNPEFDDKCDYAVVQLTPALVDQVRRRVELAREAGGQDDDLYELYFWGGTAEFYGGDLVDACQEAAATDQAAQDWLTRLEQDGHALVPPAVDLAACESQWTEVDQMVVRRCPPSSDPRYEIAWTASPKHTDVYVTTRDLPLAALENYLGNDPRKSSNE